VTTWTFISNGAADIKPNSVSFNRWRYANDAERERATPTSSLRDSRMNQTEQSCALHTVQKRNAPSAVNWQHAHSNKERTDTEQS